MNQLDYTRYDELIRKFQSFAKWWFDFLRSLAVISILFYLSERAETAYLWPLSMISALLLALYCLSYVHKHIGNFALNRYPKYPNLSIVALSVCTGGTLFGILSIVTVIVKAIASAQAR